MRPERDPEEALRSYAELVRAWAGRLDLIAPGDIAVFEKRHIEDCLRLAPLLREVPPGACADVGSGAGLPGIPLAIAEPSRLWRLFEPRRRRAAFLEEAIRVLGLNAEVVATTAREAAEGGFGRRHALVTARALAPPADALAMAEPLVAPGGVAAIFVGERADIPEMTEMWSEGIAIVRLDRL